MRKSYKKITSLMLGVGIMASALAGCAVKSSGDVVTTAAVAETTKTAATEKTTEPKKKMVFWDKSEYVEGYNTLMKAKVDAFAEEKNVEVDYVVIPSADMKQKLMAAIEAGNAPDLIVGDDTLVGQFVSMQQIAECSDIFSTVDFTDNAKVLGTFNGKEYLVPLAFTAPGMYLRTDQWEKTGKEIPTTWEELKEGAKLMNDPANGFYGMGFAMGASGGGDAEGFCRTIILDWGGIPVDEKGTVTINSPETLEALKFIASLFEEGIIPPDAITGDDSWNNGAYLAGTVGVITNSGSVVSSLKAEKPELLEKTRIIAYPAGPTGLAYTLGGANVFGIFQTGKNPEVAKDFVKYYFED
ncbi:MAG: extracellular solute-binding protein, partial [Hungatella sp.]